jgi:nanoRNase/pAp phosphatase (c-di-AMP/oligoRNAs hydrolase)
MELLFDLKDTNNIIYHCPCVDGISSLFLMKNKYKDLKYREIGIQPNKDPYNIIENNILILDYSPSLSWIKNKLFNKDNKIIIIDHHLSTINKLKDFNHERLQLIYNDKLSCCQILYDILYPNEKRHIIINYIGFQDTYNIDELNKPDVKNIITAIYASGVNLNILDEWFNKRNIHELLNELKYKGEIINNERKKEICHNINKAIEGRYENYKIWITSCNNSAIKTDVAILLCNKKLSDGSLPDFVIIWEYDYLNKKWFISARSKSNFNLLPIFEKLGGGGHAQACSTTIEDPDTIHNYFKTFLISKH